MTNSTINTVQVLNLIHKAMSRSKEKDDPDLHLLIDSVVSIFVLKFKTPFAFAKAEQIAAIKRLEEYLK